MTEAAHGLAPPWLQALLLGAVEGLTEFLPVSSTGHLILAGRALGFRSDAGRVFEVVVQLGAVLAVVGLYRERLAQLGLGLVAGSATQRRFAASVVAALLPAAALGALLIDAIKAHLFSPGVVAVALLAGGVVLLAAERRAAVTAPAPAGAAPTWPQVLAVGVAQCFALVPGVSRSGATIVGGMLSGMSRQAATEFSFFLAMPLLLGAASYDLWRHRQLLSAADLHLMVVGFAAAFFAARLSVQALLRFVATHSLRSFAFYRIALGLALLGGQAFD